jgi:hypothetical protein
MVGAVLFLVILLIFFQLIFLPVINLHRKTIKLSQQFQHQAQDSSINHNTPGHRLLLMQNLYKKINSETELSKKELRVYEYLCALEAEDYDSIENKELAEKETNELIKKFITENNKDILEEPIEKG